MGVSGEAGRRSPREAAALSLFSHVSLPCLLNTEYDILVLPFSSLANLTQFCLFCGIVFIYAAILLHTCPASRVGSWPAAALHGGRSASTRGRGAIFGERTSVDGKGKRGRVGGRRRKGVSGSHREGEAGWVGQREKAGLMQPDCRPRRGGEEARRNKQRIRWWTDATVSEWPGCW